MLSPIERELLESVAGQNPKVDKEETRTAVKIVLRELTEIAPGRSVELRIPPFAATQIVEGHTHRRGTPAAVVELNAMHLCQLATGVRSWAELVAEGRILASGERSDLAHLFPFPG
ncbi:MAG: sterol carrier family protein [Candidatus Nanopelagicales bacterium]